MNQSIEKLKTYQRDHKRNITVSESMTNKCTSLLYESSWNQWWVDPHLFQQCHQKDKNAQRGQERLQGARTPKHGQTRFYP